MQIRLNGKVAEFDPPLTLGELVQQLGIAEQRYAIEVNEELVPRSQHASHRLHPDDQVEIVQAIGGG